MKHLWIARRVAACIGTIAVTAACSPDRTVAPATATTLGPLAASLSQTGTVGTKLASPLTVVVFDQHGEALAGVAITFAVQVGSGTLDQSSVTSDANGQASVNLTLGTVAGPETVVATTAGGLTATFIETGVADSPVSLLKVSGDSASVAVGSPEQLVVRAVDQYGNAVAGATVAWSADNGATLSASTTVTGADGTATIVLLDAQPAIVDVTATLQDNPAVAATFIVTET